MIEFLIGFIAALITAVLVSVAYFYRDPERKIPSVANVLLSPADGTVISVRRYTGGMMPTINKDGRSYSLEELTHSSLLGSDGVIVSIHVSPLDVHTVRAPINGKITYLARISGGLKFMRDPLFEFTNERVSLIIENNSIEIGIVIVGAPIASSVKTRVGLGNTVTVGQRIALIRLGSLVSVILPDWVGSSLAVECGTKVVGGSTVLADFAQNSHVIKECYMPVKTTLWQRVYLVFLAVHSLISSVRGFKG